LSVAKRAQQSLRIDRAATARRLEDSEVQDWAEGQRAFISSVIDGYGDRRKAAASAVESVGAEPVMFERFGGRDSDPHQAYLAEVESSSIYVGVLGDRYGQLLPTRFSATHAEYLHAEKHGLRLSVWTEEDADREGRQQSFLDEVQTFNVTGRFGNADELQQGLEERLRAIAAEDLSPWCKVGRCLFRAREIMVGRGSAAIEAVVRDDAVADALTALDTDFGRSETTLAYWDGVYDAKVTSVASVSRAGGTRGMTIELAVSPPASPTMYSLNGVGYDEMTEVAVKVSWLGAENPLGTMSFEAEIDNPFALLDGLQVPEESLRPIALVLAYEILARTRNVARITRFRLGPSVAGHRRLAVGWIPRAAYANQPDPLGHEIEGDVTLT
jgi:Domain of unknown function (DUF4062)